MTTHHDASGISVFFPTFNDEKTIGAIIAEVSTLLPTLTDDYEVIVINDGSTDSTGDVVSEIARVLPGIRLISHHENQGYGAALRSGFRHASKDLIFYTDGDGQYDVRELSGLLPLMTPDCHVVNGYKVKRADPFHRVILGSLYNGVARLLFRLRIRDVDCDFRLIRRSALEGIHLSSSSGVICVEMIYRLQSAGCIFAESPVRHYQRPYGKSQFFTVQSVAHTVFDLLTLWIKLVVFRMKWE
ncbi:MAG: glycosyltransferase family 2 protein [Pyrinomonadaceae bacterium]